MNVLMISDVYFPRINGVSTSIETFRSDLHAIGVRSTLIAPEYPQREDDSREDGIVRIPARYLPMDPEDRMMKRAAIRAWLRDYRGPAFDLVHIQTPFVAHYMGIEIARMLKLPVIASYHTYFEEYLYHYIPFLRREWLRGLARRFSRGQCNALDALIVPSRAMADTLRGYGVTSPMHILPTGLPADRYQGGDGDYFRNRYQIPKDRPLLLFVGRVAFEKNIPFLFEVTARIRQQIPDVLLLVTGEGPALADLRERTRSMGLDDNVRFLGYLDRRHELLDCYRAADLFVFASRTETQGLVLLEAMALGTPALALSIMGTRDILEPAPREMTAPEDASAFANQAVALLKNPARLAQLGEEARSYARQWEARAMAERVARLYDNVCAGKPSASLEVAGAQRAAA
ncbi:glycosyltransferase [Uliginosibacterium sp. H1]|uniref:glycosyltransferase n=1 Tax=Uliginosibacterium sp. H1 TaxID=3114757 RepID=UPI002E185186|nr:glycosyltransferase [Uliginosibacterium sp. H1]